MPSFVSRNNTLGFDRVVLEEDVGVYAFAFVHHDSSWPQWDYFLGTLTEAKEFCLERWGVPVTSWTPTDEQPSNASAS